MLDTDTKRRINTARDILVGKVPDPKSQVEQITIALIYKFMDDMDAHTEELGGHRKFFDDGFARYGWAKLMRAGLGGQEVLNLYAEAIAKMPENPGIPPLFRNIFRNAYLPYRDPETLKSFLKIIDDFTYDHSERLGDAFEYLLSVLGSQGDAGQFRTPRHIIDFIVDIVDPKKNETILDPACGTAGFLISAYKHIVRANSDDQGQSKLTPDEKGRLSKNIHGYDISPDMVRLSLVNLYLHSFTDPHIEEYDTLTSEDKWNETADVILANPPFMSPKGGIKPHRRFSVQSKRSEVLFVDYMAEHLSPTGRAGIIVPEGIIFQSQGAYTELRKMLVEKYLVAVISLPAGVFNPYSGVKTSVLILDKSLARQSDTIGFFKAENDGFGLGAQRRGIDKNDLPQVKGELDAYFDALRNHQPTTELQSAHGLIVAKEKLVASGDYNLNAEGYRDKAIVQAAWPLVPLGEVVKRLSGGTPAKENQQYWEGSIPWVSPKDMKVEILYDTEEHVSIEAVGESATTIVPQGTVLCVVRSGILKHSLPLALTAREMCFNQDIVALLPVHAKLSPRYLFSILKARSAEILQEGIKPGVTVQSFHAGFLSRFKIPLPPLNVQNEIVAKIEGYQKVIDGARAVLDNYRPQIPLHPTWPMVELGELTKPEYGFTESASDQGDARFIRITDISEDGELRTANPKFVILTDDARQSILEIGDILVARTGATFGKTMIFEEDYPAVFASFLIRLRFPKDSILPRFYWIFAQSDLYWDQAKSLMTGGGQPQFNGNALKQIKVPVPPLPTQKVIVGEIEAEQALVAANRELIARFERKIQATLARVWGEEEPAALEV